MPSAFFLTFLPLLNRLFQAPQPSSFSLAFSPSLRHALTITVALLDVSQESPSRVLSLWNFSLSSTALPKTRTSPYRKWLFPPSTKPFRNSNGVTLCRDTMGQVSNVEDNKTRSRKQPDGGVEEPYSPPLVSSPAKGSSSSSVRIASVFPFANDYYDRRSIKHHDASQLP